MDEFDFLKDLDSSEYSLESILAEYRDGASEKAELSDGEAKARRITMEALESAIASSRVASGEGSGERDKTGEAESSVPPVFRAPEPAREPEPVYEPEPELVRSEDIKADELYSERENADEYADRDHPRLTHEQKAKLERSPKRRRSVGDTLLALLAMASMRRSKGAAKRKKRDTEAEERAPEVSVKAASRYYGAQIGSFKFRSVCAAISTLILIYIALAYSTALPLLGLMKDAGASAGVCLILLLSVMLCGIDILTNGVSALLRKKPNAETLVASFEFLIKDLLRLIKISYGLFRT